MRVLGAHSLLDAALAHARRFAGPDRVWIVCTRGERRRDPRGFGSAARAHPDRAARAQHRDGGGLGRRARRRGRRRRRARGARGRPRDSGRARVRDGAATCRAAAHAGALVTLGVQPTRPETGYGYIQVGRAAGRAYPGLHRVRRFVEKPSAAQSQRACCARAVICGMRGSSSGRRRRSSPRSSAARRSSPKRWHCSAQPRARRSNAPIAARPRCRSTWPCSSAASGSGRCPCASTGTTSEAGRRSRAELGVAGSRSCVVGGDAAARGRRRQSGWGHDRTDRAARRRGARRVDTGDALLVARLDRSGDVRRVVAQLRKRGRRDLL